MPCAVQSIKIGERSAIPDQEKKEMLSAESKQMNTSSISHKLSGVGLDILIFVRQL